MKVLVVGSGGREHAIVDALAHSPKVTKVFCAPGNGGIREQAEIVAVNADDIAGLKQFARKQAVDLTFIGPEIPLSIGVVDAFRADGMPVVGPTADQARL